MRAHFAGECEGDGALDLLGRGELGQRVEVAQLLLGCAGIAELGKELVVVGIGAVSGDGVGGRCDQLGVTALATVVRLQDCAALGERVVVVAQHGQHADQQAAQLGDEVAFSGYVHPAEVFDDRRDQRGDALLEGDVCRALQQAADTP